MDNKVVFFHINNVRNGEDYALKPGDEVTFILDEYDKGVIDVKFLPTLSVFPSTSDFSKGELESHPRDESWETVDSDSENEERTPLGPTPPSYEMYLEQQNIFKRFPLYEEQFRVWCAQQQCDPP